MSHCLTCALAKWRRPNATPVCTHMRTVENSARVYDECNVVNCIIVIVIHDGVLYFVQLLSAMHCTVLHRVLLMICITPVLTVFGRTVT